MFNKAFLKIVSVVVVVSFLWTNCIWAEGVLNNKLASQSHVVQLGQGLQRNPELGRLVFGAGLLDKLGIHTFADIVAKMGELEKRGVICFVRSDDNGKEARYIFSDNGGILRVTKKGEEVKDDFSSLLEVKGKREIVGEDIFEWSYVTDENVELINEFLAKLNEKWVVRLAKAAAQFPDALIISRFVDESEKAPAIPDDTDRKIKGYPMKYNFYSVGSRRYRKGRFVAQFNPPRQGKRPTQYDTAKGIHQEEFPVRFNYNKVSENEILIKNHRIGGMDARVVLNINPFAEGHFLLVPEPEQEHVQHLDRKEYIDAALTAVDSSSRDNLKITYNSMGAFGSINHLHFQGFYYGEGNPEWGEARLPVEKSSRKEIFNKDGVTVSELADYPARGLSFKGKDRERLSGLIFAYVETLNRLNIPYNILFTKGEVIVFPRRFEFPNRFGAGTAILEMSGEFIVFNEDTLKTITEQDIWNEFSDSAATHISHNFSVY